MNTWIWRLIARNRDEVSYRHGNKTVTFPTRMLVAIPKFITDADVANLKAALRRDEERLHA